MAASLVKVNGTEVSVEESGKTIVNINIWPGQKAPAPETPESSSPAGARCPGEQKVLGGVQVLLGFMCLGLGGVLVLLDDYFRLKNSGAPFWMGSLFVVSGSLCVLSERRGGCFWAVPATFFSMASVMAACAGLASGVADLKFLRSSPYWINHLCKKPESYPSLRATRSPNYDWRAPACVDRMKNLLLPVQEEGNSKQAKFIDSWKVLDPVVVLQTQQVKSIFSGAQILLLVSSVAALGIALFCFGYGLHLLCRRLRVSNKGNVTTENLEVPPPYEEPANENPAA